MIKKYVADEALHAPVPLPAHRSAHSTCLLVSVPGFRSRDIVKSLETIDVCKGGIVKFFKH